MSGEYKAYWLLPILLALAILDASARAADEPLVLRRQTLIVRDIDQSLKLYRDAIGMTVIYDQIIRRPHKTENRTQEIRLVFLKATSDYVGVLGLVDYEHNNPSHPDHRKPVRREGFTPGNSVVLFNTTELTSKWAAIAKAPGISVINGPTLTEYPAYDGKSKIRVNVTRFYDADGFLVEFNQPVDAIKTKVGQGLESTVTGSIGAGQATAGTADGGGGGDERAD